jgi:hypothetical protein
MALPVVTGTPDKPEYVQGETVTITFVVEGDTRTEVVDRVVEAHGHDDEGNEVDVLVTTHVRVTVPDNFTFDFVRWQDTGQALALVGLVATGTA